MHQSNGRGKREGKIEVGVKATERIENPLNGMCQWVWSLRMTSSQPCSIWSCQEAFIGPRTERVARTTHAVSPPCKVSPPEYLSSSLSPHLSKATVLAALTSASKQSPGSGSRQVIACRLFMWRGKAGGSIMGRRGEAVGRKWIGRGRPAWVGELCSVPGPAQHHVRSSACSFDQPAAAAPPAHGN